MLITSLRVAKRLDSYCDYWRLVVFNDLELYRVTMNRADNLRICHFLLFLILIGQYFYYLYYLTIYNGHFSISI